MAMPRDPVYTVGNHKYPSFELPQKAYAVLCKILDSLRNSDLTIALLDVKFDISF